jgi:hypothetical protein
VSEWNLAQSADAITELSLLRRFVPDFGTRFLAWLSGCDLNSNNALFPRAFSSERTIGSVKSSFERSARDRHAQKIANGRSLIVVTFP